MVDFEKLAEAMGDMEEDGVTALLDQVMAEGGKDAAKAMEACQKGMDMVGKKFETDEYFVADLIYAGELMTTAVGILKGALVQGETSGEREKMILCTVRGDLHDIGKNIVKSMLEAGGFDVIDLGIDVAPETVVEEAQKGGIRIVGLSGVLTLAIDAMKRTVEALRSEFGDTVKVIIGGNPVNENVCKLVGADAWAINPQLGVQICREWASVQKI
jgi:methylmalonyl-CoA mutase cobalamin-binding domain/chain